MSNIQFEVSTALEAKLREDPKSREDFEIIDEKRGMWGVFDGVGGVGHENAQYSAQKAAESFLNMDVEQFHKLAENEMKKEMEGVLVDMNEEIVSKGSESNKEVATTFTVVLKIKNGNFLYAYAGDSPLSIFQGENASLRRIIIDNNPYLEFLIEGNILEIEEIEKIVEYEYGGPICKLRSSVQEGEYRTSTKSALDITKTYFRRRNEISNYLGSPNFRAQCGFIQIKKGDILLMETDGTSDILCSEEKKDIIKETLDTNSFQNLAGNIIQAADSKLRDIESGKVVSMRKKYNDDKTVLAIRIK